MSKIKDSIRTIPNFPVDGIMFRDVTTLYSNPNAMKDVINLTANFWKNEGLTCVAGIEARGFVTGSLIANYLSLPFIPIRKKGKLPHQTISQDYDLEYGKATLEIHIDALNKSDNVLIVDDLIATGGTAEAAAKLVEVSGGVVAGFIFIINLFDLPGKKLLEDKSYFTESLMNFPGH